MSNKEGLVEVREVSQAFNVIRGYVHKFQKKFEKKVEGETRAKLRYALMREENEEYLVAAINQDEVEILDALTDEVFILCGTMNAHNISDAVMAKALIEVTRSNMSKADESGNPIYNENGKVIKGPNYSKPDLASIIIDHAKSGIAVDPEQSDIGQRPDRYAFKVVNRKSGKVVDCDMFDIAKAMKLTPEKFSVLKYLRTKGGLHKQIDDAKKLVNCAIASLESLENNLDRENNNQ